MDKPWPKNAQKTGMGSIYLVNVEEFLLTSPTSRLLVGRGRDGRWHSSPWIVTPSLSQQVVFAWETLPLSMDPTRLPKRGASHPFRMTSGNSLGSPTFLTLDPDKMLGFFLRVAEELRLPRAAATGPSLEVQESGCLSSQKCPHTLMVI